MIVTSIGERCFLQNWLWKQKQDGVLEYHENMLSRLQEYPYPSSDPVNLIPSRLARYEDFCKSFRKTAKEVDISGHAWLASEVEGCMTHYQKNIDFKARRECLKQADVVLYEQMYEQYRMESDELAQYMMRGIRKVNRNDVKFIMLSPFAKKSSAFDGCYVLKMDECPKWDMRNWEKSSKQETPDPAYTYLKGWRVTPHDVETIEKILGAVK